jgi:prepilin-type N-terminal cleavage/methylation domain-containing protein
MDGKEKSSASILLIEDGFSLVEVMMALLILVVGILGYLKVSGAIMGTNIQSTKESIAITLAQDQIETLKESQLINGDGAVDEIINVEGIVDGSGTPYTRTWSVDLHPTIPRYNNIMVTVGWNNQGPRSVTLNTQVSQ